MARPAIKSGVLCFHCESDETCKAGFDKGKQRYRCRECRRFFRDNPEVRAGKKTPYLKRASDLPSPGHLVLELRAIEQELGRTPTTTLIIDLSKANKAHSLNTYYAVFGSFTAALKRAKLKPAYKQEFDEADRDRMVGELRLLHKKLGRPIYAEDVDDARRKGTMSSPYHMVRAFGSVPLAIAAAGAGKKKYTRDEMISFLRKLDQKLGRPVMEQDIQKEFRAGHGPSDRAIAREFGGLVKARLAAKIRKWKPRRT